MPNAGVASTVIFVANDCECGSGCKSESWTMSNAAQTVASQVVVDFTPARVGTYKLCVQTAGDASGALMTGFKHNLNVHGNETLNYSNGSIVPAEAAPAVHYFHAATVQITGTACVLETEEGFAPCAELPHTTSV